MEDPDKAKIYHKFMNPTQMKMASYIGKDGKKVKGIEDYVPNTQYLTEEHQKSVVQDIAEYWRLRKVSSYGHRFHGIFATSSIPEAIDYYRLFKQTASDLKTTCLFDPNIDNVPGFAYKEEGLLEVLDDYNKRYEMDYTLATHANFKKDVALRLAHKEHYKYIEKTPEKELDLLIVVNQMLTGFDSKWVNTLYLDKMLEYENIIQAFSRTNRLFGQDKPFGTIRYYRRPHTMEQNIKAAVKLYSGDKPLGLFVEKMQHNLEGMNLVFDDIVSLFQNARVPDFERLPSDPAEKAKFASLYKELNKYLDAARVQGFRWEKLEYEFVDEESKEKKAITIKFGENTYLILAKRYKELEQGETSGSNDAEAAFDLVSYLTEIDTGMIDADYMNSRFDKYYKLLKQDGVSEEVVSESLDELHKTFATLSQEEQKYANIFLHDIQRGDATIEEGMTLRDCITEYMHNAKENQIHEFSVTFGLDEAKLNNMMQLSLSDTNLNEFGRFDELMKTVDFQRAKTYFEKIEGIKLNPPKVRIKTDKMLREFITYGGVDI